MRIISFTLLLFISQIGVAQLFGPAQLIDDEAGIVDSILTGDFDNDGDIDIVKGATGLVALYENLDGLGTFSAPIPIQEGFAQPFSMTAADFDDDNKLDLVVSYFGEDEVWWYKNLGNGNFASGLLLASGLNRASGVVAGDLNGDNDPDLVLGVSNGQGLYWIENLPGSGNFSAIIPIDPTIIQARTQALGDINGDDDLDILTNSSITGGVIMSWYENLDGQGGFSNQRVIETSGSYEIYLFLVDLDGDDDLDIISNKTDELLWRENLNGLGTFGPEQTIDSGSASSFVVVRPVDLDNDDDLDIVTVSPSLKVNWYENLDGLGTFSTRNLIDGDIASPTNVQAGDFDNDGDMDLAVSSLVANGEKILVWYENRTILGTDDLKLPEVSISPNPIDNVLIVTSPITILNVVVYDVQGRNLREFDEGFEELDMTGLSSGILFVQIVTEQGDILKKVIKR